MSVRAVLNDNVLEIILDRPEKKNALDPNMLQQLTYILKRHESSRELRALVISGAEKCFCSGADIAHLATLTGEKIRHFHDMREEVFNLVETFPAPTVARLEGHVLGSGLLLALCTDIRIASQKAVLGIPSSLLGITESYSFIARLLKRVNIGTASLMMLAGQKLTAEEGRTMGLVEQVLGEDELDAHIGSIMGKLRTSAADAVRRSKVILNRCNGDLELDQVSDPASPFIYSVSSREANEGTRAFMEKRQPRFKE